MRDGLIKRGGAWAFVIDVGEQPAQRCLQCDKRRWVDGEALQACPECGGELRAVRERRQRWHSGYPTRAAAKAARDEARVRLARGAYVPPSTVTVEDFLLEWLEGLVHTRKAATVAAYRHKLSRYVIPAIGSIRLQQLGARHLEALYVDLLERGGPRGPLSITTVRTVHAIVRKALQDAYRRDEVALNVAAKATVPTRRGQEGDRLPGESEDGPALRSWNSEQVRAFVAALQGQRLAAAYILAINTGMRRGEVLGLAWADVDLDVPRLTVRQSLVSINGHTQLTTPKTGRARTFQLDEASASALRQYRAVQHKERLLWGELWQDTGLVFTKEDGTRIQPESFTKTFRAIIRATGLPPIRFHDYPDIRVIPTLTRSPCSRGRGSRSCRHNHRASRKARRASGGR
jgi:integrase